MMSRNYLLTYLKDKIHQYEWFETEEEMQDFVDTTDIDEILDSLEVSGIREIEIEFNK